MEPERLDKDQSVTADQTQPLDQEYQRINPPKKGLWWKLCLIILAFLLVASAVTVLAVWYSNTFVLTLELYGVQDVYVEYGDGFTDPGAQAQFRGTLLMRTPETVAVEITGEVDVEKLGDYTLTYRTQRIVDYYFGKLVLEQQSVRTVHVVDTTVPEIELVITGDYTLPGHDYEEEGYTATDSHDGSLTERVRSVCVDGVVYYRVSDSSGNMAVVTREIFYDDPIPPVLTLEGDAEVSLIRGSKYVEPGYKAEDNCDGDLTHTVTVSGEVDTKTLGTYELVYSVTDSYQNTTTATRTVEVRALPKLPDLPDGDYQNPAEPNGKVIFLTFDDGPGPYTEKLLGILSKYGVKATFFVVNTGYTHILSQIAAQGHTLAMHSATHNYSQIYANEAAYFDDLKAIQDLIYSQTGQISTMLRFPGGSSNMVSAAYNEGIMTRLTAMIREMGYRYYDWNVDSRDAGGASSPEEVYANVVGGIYRNNVSIVLQHDIHWYSVDAVEWIIQWGIANGYSFQALTTSSPGCEHHVNN